ncbi:alpha/beta hydrolase, partial [Acinetobacter baumannii]|nr:alpha/beta hydrolase [Acinetobacter baumannii]
MNSALQFSITPYTPFMQETKVNVSNGIELQVE